MITMGIVTSAMMVRSPHPTASHARSGRPGKQGLRIPVIFPPRSGDWMPFPLAPSPAGGPGLQTRCPLSAGAEPRPPGAGLPPPDPSPSSRLSPCRPETRPRGVRRCTVTTSHLHAIPGDRGPPPLPSFRLPGSGPGRRPIGRAHPRARSGCRPGRLLGHGVIPGELNQAEGIQVVRSTIADMGDLHPGSSRRAATRVVPMGRDWASRNTASFASWTAFAKPTPAVRLSVSAFSARRLALPPSASPPIPSATATSHRPPGSSTERMASWFESRGPGSVWWPMRTDRRDSLMASRTERGLGRFEPRRRWRGDKGPGIGEPAFR